MLSLTFSISYKRSKKPLWRNQFNTKILKSYSAPTQDLLQKVKNVGRFCMKDFDVSDEMHYKVLHLYIASKTDSNGTLAEEISARIFRLKNP